ncbi:MAG: ABC transporter substrate-binding protein [Spirochaetaceae bacterium]|jgi:iron complex transport system substrate-binding protein|nr:ABC transporter substrate-binding protein [Spirochaetaceae bacterium]
MKQRFFVPALFFACICAVNAGGNKTPARDTAGFTLFTDSAGRTVNVPRDIKRIAPSGSLAQIFLIAVAPDMLCAVSSAYSPYGAEFIPAYLANLPVIGQFYGAANLNLEEIARIAPDLVIDVGEPKETIARDMDEISASVGIPVIHVTATLRTTPEAFRTLGRLLGREKQGERIARFCEKTLSVADKLMERVGNRKKSVLYCLGNSGLNVLARGTFHTELLDWMADTSAVVDSPTAYGSGNEANFEQILLWDPEVILFGPGSVYDTAAQDPAWRELRAIKNGAYYEVPMGPYNWMGGPPSINRYLGMIWLPKVLYPEYTAYDLYTEVAEYYRLFYSHELTREQFASLTARSLPAGVR